MMETKLWLYLCVLLLFHSGSAEHDGDHGAVHAAAHSDVSTKASPAVSVPDLSLDSVNAHLNDSATSTNGTEGLTNNASTDEETTIMTSNDEKSAHTTNESPSELPVVTAESHSSPSHPPAIISTTDVAHTSSVDVPNIPPTSPDYNVSHNTTPPLSDSTINLGKQTGNPGPTAPPTSAPAPETPIATSGNQSRSTSGSGSISPQEPSGSHTSSSPSDLHTEVTGDAQPWSSSTLSNSPSLQAKTHGDNPSQLNVGEDPTVRHDSPKLDPLLAGLVSAFIITAVIFTLLVFLKLRRRDNRPEFRRLQDLPMDDMMEDTSLTMYSY
ncbi:DNA-directed RNA polymerase II subunit RPB1-like [Gouania willdenowi]|uniref:DNA-directed RNA polymerase II subunit RPB1-like n=1 Tax=Gouania willdenowi TaxID=441366 RepID=A0A8C5D7M1_GOUWI|nr:DNA-directed RNA polymerase II subunit RPB1-like [Gouania willdenowi]